MNDRTYDEEKIRLTLRQLAPGLDFSNPKLLVLVKSFAKPVKMFKRQKFVPEGQVCSKLGLLINGNLKAYFLDAKGDRHVSRLYDVRVNPIVVAMDSFRNGTPATETIQAVNDVFMLVISRQHLDELYDSFPEFNALGRNVAEESYCQAVRKLRDFKTLKPEERVKLFMSTNKHLLQTFSKSDIASYLGLHRNGLSKILQRLEEQKRTRVGTLR